MPALVLTLLLLGAPPLGPVPAPFTTNREERLWVTRPLPPGVTPRSLRSERLRLRVWRDGNAELSLRTTYPSPHDSGGLVLHADGRMLEAREFGGWCVTRAEVCPKSWSTVRDAPPDLHMWPLTWRSHLVVLVPRLARAGDVLEVPWAAMLRERTHTRGSARFTRLGQTRVLAPDGRVVPATRWAVEGVPALAGRPGYWDQETPADVRALVVTDDELVEVRGALSALTREGWRVLDPGPSL